MCEAMNHGGPYPASSIDSTSVGTPAIFRFVRAVSFQDFPSAHLPRALRDDNPDGILRRVNGDSTTEKIDTASYTMH